MTKERRKKTGKTEHYQATGEVEDVKPNCVRETRSMSQEGRQEEDDEEKG